MSEEEKSPQGSTDEPLAATATAVETAPAPVPTRPAQGRSLWAPFRYGLSILILCGAVAAAYGLSLLAKPTESQNPTALVPKVVLQKVDSYAGSIDLLVSGTVVPHKEINVPAEVTGRVIKKYPDCLAGNFVKKGTPLIQIDPESYQMEVDTCLLYTSPSPRDATLSRMPSSA